MSSENEPVAATEVTENANLIAQQRTLHEMLARSAVDKEFRQLLIADPRGAFASYGVELPAGLKVCFVENEHDATIVLPDPIGDAVRPAAAG
ncbi:MAG TPA: hypothetical protein VFE05_00565 [Longimicrobiaceae bacterium]|jgi:hypothetical protein|nr:hypothetical protein [Longimicrobiaceae bacterium]